MVYHWLKMGGYALYVWPAFSIVLSVLAYNGIKPYLTYRALIKQLRLANEARHAPHS